MLAELPLLRSAASSDPVLFYSLASALLLAVVSLYSGLSRLDLVALFNPRTLLRVVAAVAFAFVLRALAEATTSSPAAAGSLGSVAALLLPGLHRFPLYVVALAYGPTAGLLVAVLFAAFASSTLLPGLNEAVLALELVVLGWLAIFPSPRTTRWAGPFGAALAYALAWGTAGIAVPTYQGVFVTLSALLALHADVWPGVLLACALLTLVSPRVYSLVFPGSRIAPELHRGRSAGGRSRRTGPVINADAAAIRTELTLTDYVRQDARHHGAFVPPPPDVPRARARLVKQLGPYALPDDSLER